MPSRPKNDTSVGKAARLIPPPFLPVTRAEMDRLGWPEVDILLITGDAYVDHPAFGAALLGRWLMDHGWRVGLVPQPRWDNLDDVTRLGRPRLFTGVTAGALDSLLAHYTAFRKKRHDDAYSPGGQPGARPNRAAIVYANLARQAFPGTPIVLGGIEASLRRVTHYDFWGDALRRSILLDAKADLLVYGLAERAVLEIATRLEAIGPGSREKGLFTRHLAGIPGTAFVGQEADLPVSAPIIHLPAHEEILADPRALLTATLKLEAQVHQGSDWAVQKTGGRLIILTPPAPPLTTPEMDRLYCLPFTRRAHPTYSQPIPALDMLAGSVTTHRGCGGGCAFCSLAGHQGRRISSRSAQSVRDEVARMARGYGWTGSLTDVGGPTANMWGAVCTQKEPPCRRPSCLFPEICRHFQVDQGAFIELLRSLKNLPEVNHVRVASGLRYDLALKDPKALQALVAEFVGGQLKVAPEHVVDGVLKLMRKPGLRVFQRFLDIFTQESRQAGKEQYLIPYLMSGLPGCTDADMAAMADWLKKRGWRPRQVQCFIPTPGTLATAMYYAQATPDGRPLYVARTDAQRQKQHSRFGLTQDEKAKGQRKRRTSQSSGPPHSKICDPEGN